ncbi:MAG: hypothetical protein ACRD8A_04220 [Candidatus Acidiferrales bacterium]
MNSDIEGVAMNQFFDFAGVAGAIVFSIGFAVYLEWLGMRGLMRLMPPRPVLVRNVQNAGAKEHGRASKVA